MSVRTNMSEYRIWSAMKLRVLNDKSTSWKNYGGRGIKVCDRWLQFDNFFKDMGPRPSKKHSIDRIDNNGNYEPSNCRWATAFEQMNNCRKNIIFRYDGRTQTLPEWARERGISVTSMSARYYRGWSIDRIMEKEKCNVGSRVSNSKLTDDIVRQIRTLYVYGDRKLGSSALARRFGVRQCTVWNILNRKWWKHVE